MLGVGCWALDVGRWMLGVGCWTLDVGRWMLGWMLDVGWLPSSRRQRRVPILPDRLVAEAANELGDPPRRSFVGDVELAGGAQIAVARRGPFARAQVNDPSPLGAVNVLLSGSGVAARFRMAAGAHQGDAERNQTVAQSCRLARGQNEADIGE